MWVGYHRRLSDGLIDWMGYVCKDENAGGNAGSSWITSNTIKITRGCHIEAERRLLSRATLVNHANLYYGCWSAVLTILSLDQKFASLTLPAACFASSVALWAAYASAEKYELRARDFYYSYLTLQKLWARCEDVESRGPNDSEYESEINQLREEYYEVLASTENHSEKDYISYIYGEYKKSLTNREKKNLSITLRIKRIRYCLCYVALRLAIYLVVPIILLLSPVIANFIIKLMCYWGVSL